MRDSHNAGYPKGRYVRHVMWIIMTAIRERTSVPWDEVHSKASMRGTQSNISDEVALQSETYLPPMPRYVSRPVSAPQIEGRPGILKHRPAPVPPSTDPNGMQPALIAVSCNKCMENGLPCQTRQGWKACIPCHERKERCSFTPITSAHNRAVKNRAAVEAANKGKQDDGNILYSQLDKVQHDLTMLIDRQESTRKVLNDVAGGMKRLRETMRTSKGYKD